MNNSPNVWTAAHLPLDPHPIFPPHSDAILSIRADWSLKTKGIGENPPRPSTQRFGSELDRAAKVSPPPAPPAAARSPRRLEARGALRVRGLPLHSGPAPEG